MVLVRRVRSQGYPAEPLRQISALQAILELSGEFLTGIANLAGNLMLAKACWICDPSYALAGKN